MSVAPAIVWPFELRSHLTKQKAPCWLRVTTPPAKLGSLQLRIPTISTGVMWGWVASKALTENLDCSSSRN
ncbi:hypothetical protein CGRA01v4_12759 [Colletotrichum graminicola]|nr:hypothetical protein CGRA01v4_12759 [Colletotrichum graminicola]